MNKLTYLCLIVFCATFLTQASPFSNNTSTAEMFNDIQRVRIDFTMPNGYVRHLLLAFTPDNAATDGVDYGYDALNFDNFPDDLNWMIDSQRYVIQGVGAFDVSKHYPLGMFLSNSGDIAISLDTLENFNTDISVYLYDTVTNTHTLLNNMDFQQTVTPGTYLDRYYITFANTTFPNDLETQLSISEEELIDTKIAYLLQSNELVIESTSTIEQIEIYNLLGQNLSQFKNINNSHFRNNFITESKNYHVVRVYTSGGVFNKIVFM
ncbi:hypothetical protein [Xanthomarina sp. GH4-25]|uniref:hypothetical protein n=1 Tax=Xanthomarina sp. GH4-25 TaxID=3349335 RepID=UPI003877A6E8